jgi:hypothetical protein
LLDHIDLEDIRLALSNASLLTYKRRDVIPQDIAEALADRLEFREQLLRAIELAAETDYEPAVLQAPWDHLGMLWEAISKSHALGLPVPEAFSTKIQRKLASTMPPRPIVHLSFGEASSHFKRLILDGKAVVKVLDFKDSQSLLVSPPYDTQFYIQQRDVADNNRTLSSSSKQRSPSHWCTSAPSSKATSSRTW